jgi:hypothetical protein
MKKSLLSTNPYFKDATSRERGLALNIESSSAVEGISVKRDAATGRFVATETNATPICPVKKTTR